MRDALRPRGGLVLRVLVSALLLGAVLAYADLGEVVRALRDGEWEWFLAGTSAMACVVLIGAIRWRLLLAGAEIAVSRLRASRVFAASMILNNVLPTAVGGDAVRTWLVGRESRRLAGAAAATIADRVTGVLLLFALGWVALALDPGGVPASLVAAFAWVTLGVVLACVVGGLVVAGVRPVLHRLPQRVVPVVRDAWSAVRAWTGSPSIAISLLGLGLAYQALAVLALILVAKTIGVELSFALAAISAAVVLVVLVVPISVGGLGLREGGFVVLLGQADIDAAQATLLSLLGVAAVLLASAAVVAAATVVEGIRARAAETRAAPDT